MRLQDRSDAGQGLLQSGTVQGTHLLAGVLARLPSVTAARQFCWGMAAPAGCTCPSSWRRPAGWKLLRRGSSSLDSTHTTCAHARVGASEDGLCAAFKTSGGA